ncbi:MAG: hypothetical protein MJE12_19415, partial [Alphaproteobacteria bacterium]|nr:hypothetical protein [Alphaproteobacteria bacterium]
ILKTEIVEKAALIRRLATHHRNALPMKIEKTESRQMRHLKRLYQQYRPEAGIPSVARRFDPCIGNLTEWFHLEIHAQRGRPAWQLSITCF